MRTILTDLRRALLSRAFLLAALAMGACVGMGAFRSLWAVFQMAEPRVLLGYHEDLFLEALGGEAVLFAVPILAAVPYTAAFVEDVKSGFLKPCLTRTTVDRYVWGKSLGAAASGGLVLVTGLCLAFGALWLLLAPVEVYGELAVPSRLPEIGLRLLLFFLSGALWATAGLLLSALVQNVYLAYAAPFVLYYVLVILRERYFRAAFLLDPRDCLTLAGPWPLGGKSAALTLLSLVILFQLLFYLIAQRELRDERRLRALWALAARPLRIPRRDFRPRREWGVLREVRQVMAVVRYNFRMWRGNMRVLLTFCLAFILCFLLSDKAASFAYDMGTAMQAFEPFVWTFGDANSILLVSLLLILLFVDVPFLGAGVPYYLVRMRRRTWAWGQLVYIALATLLYMVFIFAATTLLCAKNSFPGNMWSETAAILGYSGAGKAVALVKTLEMSRPYPCAASIFLLMLLYTLVLALFMLLCRLLKGRSAGIVGAFGFSLYGLLLNPALFRDLMRLPDELVYKANVIVGWASPLNQATYHMHNFGYDLLPRLRDTYLIFGGTILLLFLGVQLAIRRYSFTFTGTEGSL